MKTHDTIDSAAKTDDSSATHPDAVQDLDLLNAEECALVEKAIFDAKEHWVQRKPQVPFYTLGTNSYMDAVNQGYAAYSEMIRKTNPLLLERFGVIYDRLPDVLAERVGGRFRFDERRALPGFHIFLTHPAFTKMSAGRHYDLQHEPLDWAEVGTIEAKKQLSLTLSVALPSAGSGLLVWDINHLELEGKTSAEIKTVRDTANDPWVHDYKLGSVAIHSGYYEHQIEPMREYVPGEARITMQAHTLPVDGEWVIYW